MPQMTPIAANRIHPRLDTAVALRLSRPEPAARHYQCPL